jgi:hypothetical protein
MPPTPQILHITDLLDTAISRFLSARKSIPPLGKYESEVEAMLLFNMAIRGIEAICTLARTDLVLIVSANVLARTIFEIALKAAWMVQPEDPFACEVRYLAHLAEEERLLRAISERVIQFGGDPVVFTEQLTPIREFRVRVAAALPPGFTELPGNPSVEEMLKALNQGQTYAIYRLLAQFVHGGHSATWTYRKGLGTLRQTGEFVTSGSWYIPLWTAWKSLQVFGGLLLRCLKAAQPVFLTPEEVGLLDLSFGQLTECDRPAN